MPCSSTKKAGAGSCANCSCGAGATSVKLPSKKSKSQSETTPLLWSTTPSNEASYQSTATPGAAGSSSSQPNAEGETECPVTSHDPSFVCCREAIPSDNRTLIDPDFARDCIVGLSDGLTVPFALTAGLSSVGSSKLVVLAGLAELVSGAISMGIGGFLSAQAELSHYAYNERLTRERVQRSCQSEIQRQVQDILRDYGIGQDTCAKVAFELARRESEQRQLELSQNAAAFTSSTKRSSRRKLFGCIPLPSSSAYEDQESQTSAAVADESDAKGLTPFLLRVGEGLEPVSTSRLYISALTIGLSYFVGGIIPLLPYMFIQQARQALTLSVIITGIILLVFGIVKQRFTGGEGGVKGYAYGAISTLMVGGIAAGASWLIVGLLEGGSDGGI
ncbi:DUF125-domain-containing protein [Testicularia cyperi]|uniref:DUF125-domain-containing protein n=1 Tax=Testicularia cyperi TaxID=1882483 RepID=A0A317XPS8_9BASI|nr:DUF125-domain-containing protein [Testicularia cyperi]